ncbi:MAG: hypothetical protein ACJ748_03725, partial [Flavisolibacter sp.]
QVLVTEYNTTTRMSTSSIRSYHYYQRGDDGEMIPLASLTEIRALVKDCPIASDMISKRSKIRKGIRAEPDYLNKVFQVYNNDCKDVD